MRYYISADGGGTKLVSLLFDENLRLRGVGKSGSVNINFSSREEVRSHMEESIRECLKEARPKSLDTVYFAGPGPADLYEEVLGSMAETPPVRRLCEGAACVYAGLLKDSGVAAIAGTGSSVFCIEGGERKRLVGGWGSLVGDEGSGYDIGRMGIRAAIGAYEGREPETLLLKLLYDAFEITDMRQMVPKIYGNSYRQVISGVCRLVAQAAGENDAAAIRIFEEAGDIQANQVADAVRLEYGGEKAEVVIAGSAWKGSSVMFETFQSQLNKACPQVKVREPVFVPVAGGVVRQLLKTGPIDAVKEDFLRTEYRQFLFNKGSDVL